MKSSIDEIRARFDADVERFSDPKGGQASTMDAGLALDMIVGTIGLLHAGAGSLFDIGCGETSTFIMEALKDSGFAAVDIVHKNSCFAAIMAVKGRRQ